MPVINHPHTISQKEERIRHLEDQINDLVRDRNSLINKLKADNADNLKRIETLSRDLWVYRYILLAVGVGSIALVNLVGISRIFEFAWDAFNRLFLNYRHVEKEKDDSNVNVGVNVDVDDLSALPSSSAPSLPSIFGSVLRLVAIGSSDENSIVPT